MSDKCVKRTYRSRSKAKKARRGHEGAGGGFKQLRPYYCPEHQGWHLGHLSQMVVGGFESRAEHFGTSK